MLYCWSILYSPQVNEGAEGAIFGAMNSLVHVIMYCTSKGGSAGMQSTLSAFDHTNMHACFHAAYYGARVLGFKPPGDILITAMQLVQMVIGSTVAGYRIFGCSQLTRPAHAWAGLLM